MYSSRFIGAVDGTAASLELQVRESLSLPLPLSLFLSRLCVHNRDWIYPLQKFPFINIYNTFKTTMHKNHLGKSNRGPSINKQAPLIYKIPPKFLILNLQIY